MATLCESALNINSLLASAEADTATFGVVHYMIDAARGRITIYMSSIKMAMMAFEQQVSGYSDGLLMVDWTYKIFFERLSLLVLSTVSIRQTGKITGFGPAPEDGEAVETMVRFQKEWVDTLLKGIRGRSLPTVWSERVRTQTYTAYAAAVADTAAVEYAPGGGGSDLAPQACGRRPHRFCKVHDYRSIMGKAKTKMKFPTIKRGKDEVNSMDYLYESMTFIYQVPPVFVDLITYVDPQGVRCDGAMLKLFKEAWAAEVDLLQYLEAYHLYLTTSRAFGPEGEPNDTNTLERANEGLKASYGFSTMEGAGVALEQAKLVGYRIGRDMTPLDEAPLATADMYKKAQSMNAKGWPMLGFTTKAEQFKQSVIFPSTELIKKYKPDIPDRPVTVAEQINHIRVWAKEFIGMLKNPKAYVKLHDGSWDFDVLCDMLNSFWVLTPITDGHPKYKALKEAGICYKCTCPSFLHYHVCKHVIAYALHKKEINLPLHFNMGVVGKRKAPAGARSTKRSGALTIDD